MTNLLDNNFQMSGGCGQLMNLPFIHLFASSWNQWRWVDGLGWVFNFVYEFSV